MVHEYFIVAERFEWVLKSLEKLNFRISRYVLEEV